MKIAFSDKCFRCTNAMSCYISGEHSDLETFRECRETDGSNYQEIPNEVLEQNYSELFENFIKLAKFTHDLTKGVQILNHKISIFNVEE